MEDEAKALFLEGQSEYELGHFEAALTLFEKAYKKKSVAGLLYNIAQCHRQLGHLREAKITYGSFLGKAPDHPFSKLAREKLDEVERALDAQASARTAPPTGLAPSLGEQSRQAEVRQAETGQEESRAAAAKAAEAKAAEAKAADYSRSGVSVLLGR